MSQLFKFQVSKITYHLIYMIDISFKQHLHLLLLFYTISFIFEHISSKDDMSSVLLTKSVLIVMSKITRFQVQSENSHSKMFQKSPVNFTENEMMDYRVY